MFLSEGEYTQEVQQKSAEILSDTPAPHHKSVRLFIAQFRETGSPTDVPSSGRPPVLTERRLDISDHILQTLTTSYGKLQQQTDIS
jgi:transposase